MRRALDLALLLAASLSLACVGGGLEGAPAVGNQAPSDDPAEYPEVTGEYETLDASEPQWLIPGPDIPSELQVQPSNNNVDIHFFEDQLFLAWRTAPYHFADPAAQLLVMASSAGKQDWSPSLVVSHGSDVREPRLYDAQGQLHLMYFEAGVEPTAFEPKATWLRSRDHDGQWGEPTLLFDEVEVPWDIKERGGRLYLTSYVGGHYQDATAEPLELRFRQSEDGVTWSSVGAGPTVYWGGVSEAAFEFDQAGDLWAVTRNEDCDSTGCGSHVCFAKAEALGDWDCSEASDPRRFDSPELFRYGSEIFVAARRNLGETFGPEGDLLAYSLTPKTTAIYRIERDARQLVHIMDLPGTGDTAFPAIRRLDAHRFLLANYTSPVDQPELSWLDGQISPEGTSIYLLELSFMP